MALGKEHLQHLRFLRLAEIGAEQEEGERDRDADRDLVEPHELEAEPLRQAVGNRAAAHREDGAEFVGPAPEEAQEQRPEKGRLEAAKGEHVDEPDEARRRQRDAEDDDADDGRRRRREATQLTLRDRAAMLLRMVQVDILDDGRRSDDQEARNGRDGRGERPDDGKADECGRQRRDDCLRDDVVDAAVALKRPRQHAVREDAREVDADVHEADDDRADEHGPVQALRVLVADAAHDRLRQRNRADADKDPLRQVEPDRHVTARERLEHLRMVQMDVLHDGRIAAAHLEHVVEQERDTDHHHDGTARVRDGHGTEAADARVEHDDETEEQETHLIAVARDRREELRAADELCRHRAAEEQHDDERRHRREAVRLEPFADDIDDRYRIEAPREHGHALAEDAEHEKDGRDLHDRHVDPAEADLPGHAGPADE